MGYHVPQLILLEDVQFGHIQKWYNLHGRIQQEIYESG